MEMNRKLNALIAILMAFAFLISATPMLAASSDNKESTKKTTSSKNTKSKDIKKKSSAKKDPTSFKGSVNINTATKEQLMHLPGIGEVKAQSIITARKKNGKFKNLDDVLKTKGIGESHVIKIKDYITFQALSKLHFLNCFR